MMRREVGLLLAAALLSGCTTKTTTPTNPGRPLTKPAKAKGYGPILFIPLNSVDTNYVKSHAKYFKDKLGLNITVLAPMDSGFGARDNFNTERNQQRALEVINEIIVQTNPNYHSGTFPTVSTLAKYKVIVAITNQDLYNNNKPDEKFVFAIAAGSPWENRIAVVSLRRLEPSFYKQKHQSKVVRERLRKLLTKQIGKLYYGLPGSTDPSSVLYDGINSIEDVDRMGEGF